MGRSARNFTNRWLTSHREWEYQKAIGKVLRGVAEGDYVVKRAEKLDEVKKHRK